MIQYIIKSELHRFRDEISLTEQANVRKTAATRSLSGSTFLSHSSKDEDLVLGAIRVLEGHGAVVYVDEIDPEMPPYTNEETAGVLKNRIGQTQRFVVLASNNSKDRRCVPWELGVADRDKGLEGIALFPTSDTPDDQAWASWEYLGLYRRI